jgi:predicted  nucleic acid-binding Zn-ribbon protein
MLLSAAQRQERYRKLSAYTDELKNEERMILHALKEVRDDLRWAEDSRTSLSRKMPKIDLVRRGFFILDEH